ncbi:C-type lectin 1 [Aphelenchoides avenae]|nr:C-type lectin 1 [Aphelenchus avenae]
MLALLLPLAVFLVQLSEASAFECASSSTRSLYDGACYEVRSPKKSFSDAELDCAASGGHLASIHSQVVQDFLARFAASANVGSVFWIGAVARAGAADWTWTDGSPWNFTYWATGVTKC